MMDVSFQFFSKSIFALMVAVAIMSTAGCGEGEPPTGTISGKLSIGDEPFGNCKVCVRSQTVAFGNRAARVAEDGTFSILKVPPGEFQVMVAPIPEIEDPLDPTPRPPSEAQVFERIDRKFGGFTTSGVTVSVNADKTSELNIDLSK